MRYYRLLDDHTFEPITMQEFGRSGIVNLVRDEVEGGGFVSTIFLGIDHAFGQVATPILFETMAFGMPSGEEWQERASSYDQAMVNHFRMTFRLRDFLRISEEPKKILALPAEVLAVRSFVNRRIIVKR